MSDKIKFYNRTGYGEWNEKVVGKAKQFCVLCGDALDVLYKNGIAVWTGGHNAEPLEKGSCCNFCNDTKVIPARLRSAKQGGLSFREEKMFLNEHHDIINMKNNLIDMLGRLNDAIEEEVDDEDR